MFLPAPDVQPLRMVRRFLGYGFLGWALEVSFTSVSDSLSLRDRRLKGYSYLWMLPIYGAGGMLLELLHERLASRGVQRWARALADTAGIYGVEFGSAALLNRLTGVVPWRYRRGVNLRGHVRLDYAPFWYACGWLFETVQSELRKLDRPARRAHRSRISARVAGAASGSPRAAWSHRPAARQAAPAPLP
jgi:uncharacterized membrane protein